RLEQIHDQRVISIKAACAQSFAQTVPIRLYQLRVQPFLLVESLLLGHKDWRLARETEVGDLYFGAARVVRAVPAAGGKKSESKRGEQCRRQERCYQERFSRVQLSHLSISAGWFSL